LAAAKATAKATARAWVEDVLREVAIAPSPVRSLYVHVPFCFHKCHYCDFYSIVDTRDRQAAFTSRLCDELRALAPFAGRLRTIFVGGGTPSLLRVEHWRDVLACLRDHFDLSAITRGRAAAPDATTETEFTVECNPETVTPELFATLVSGGVDRVSIGAQSFHPAHLKTLERWHDPANVARAVGLAREAGIQRVSVDLIFAIPGQTVAEWRADLATAIDLGVDHVSCYNLTYEANTAMTARLNRGEFTPLSEDDEIEMHHATWAMLRAAGFSRYEVSNYARPHQESRHNLAYWRQAQWLAAGPSASAHVAGARWKNVPRLDDYLTRVRANLSEAIDVEGPDEGRALRERVMTGLRVREGLDEGVILAEAERVRPGAAQRLASRVAWHAELGAVEIGSVREVGSEREGGPGGKAAGKPAGEAGPRRVWRLTDQGILIADAVARDLMRVLA
jgi:oxygen-independent coproporphyrinogen-3 oxidase